MNKIMALDLGDQWIGIALTDKFQLFARPYQTIKTDELEQFLSKILKEEEIKQIVIGYPKTMKGTESDQTRKIIENKNNLEKIFPEVKFILWDERLSSKRAQEIKPARSKEEKLKSHAIAAAFILDSYLSFLKLSL